MSYYIVVNFPDGSKSLVADDVPNLKVRSFVSFDEAQSFANKTEFSCTIREYLPST